MEFYLYSHQDLIIKSNDFKLLKADSFYQLKLDKDEIIVVYSTTCSGSIVLNYEILTRQQHNHIAFHKVNANVILCEIKPFNNDLSCRQFRLDESTVDIFDGGNFTIVYFNNQYYGFIDDKCQNVQFESVKNGNNKFGIITTNGSHKNIIIFNKSQVVFCGQYVDKEILKNYIQVYLHIPNIFNVGQLIKYDCLNNKIIINAVKDSGEQCLLQNNQFTTIYFMESLKCGRYKYAHSKLSYELKSEITKETLAKYFGRVDAYYYLHEQDVYITFCAHKIRGVYHIDIKNNMICNIY